MIDGEAGITGLAREQQALQFPSDPMLRSARNRALSDYSFEFGLPGSNWLGKYLSNLIQAVDHAVFIDLGCGDTVALTDALLLADIAGKNNLRAVGVDLLLPDPECAYLPSRRLKPEFKQDDIEQFVFPEQADLVTMCKVLLWTRDPLQALANAAAQTKVGGLLCVDSLNRINEAAGDIACRSFIGQRILNKGDGQFPGFQFLKIPGSYPREAILKKVEPLFTPVQIMEAWFGGTPRLESREENTDRGGFYFYYSSP